MERDNFSIKKGFLKKAVHDVEHDVDHVSKELEKVVVAVAKDAVKVLKNIGEDVAFAPLLIFKPVMKREIAKRGLTDDGTLLNITGTFIKALMQEHKPQNFDRYNAMDKFNFPIAPALVAAPVHVATGAIGIPTIPSLPDPANVLWGFFHKESQKPASHTAQVVAAVKKAKAQDESLSGKLKEVFKDKKKMAIIGGVL